MKLAFVTEHPTGGYAIAVPVGETSHSRNLRGWFPTWEQCHQACRRWNAKIKRELKEMNQDNDGKHL